MAELSNKKQLNEKLKCILCSSAPKKPTMCKFCKRLFCSDCAKNWLLTNDYCVNYKKKITDKDLIVLPFVEDMIPFYIHVGENTKDKNKSLKDPKISNKNEENDFQNICQKHSQNFEYYCFDCDKNFCSKCLIFLSSETQKHKDHLIIIIKEMEKSPMKEVINKYKKKIKNLEIELTEEKKKNKESDYIILNLKKDINREIQKNNELKKQLDYQNIPNKNLEALLELILEKHKKIKELELQLSRITFKIKEGEELISIIFISSDEKVLFSNICKNTDEFNEIEKQLYNNFPEYNEDDIFFSFKGKKIDRKKTLEQNGIKNNDFIIINKFK